MTFGADSLIEAHRQVESERAAQADTSAHLLAEQAHTIAEQAQRISVLSLCLHQALVHAPQFVRTQVAERLSEAGLEEKQHG